jgi:adenylate cyclase class 2
MAPHAGIETEIKLAVADAAAGRALLRRAGFRISRRKVFEANTVFDTPQRTLRGAGCLLRVRHAGSKSTLTYKGPPAADSRHKSREELEVEVPAAAAVAAIVERLGFESVFRYEKYRTEYRQPGGGGVATLDETPIGVYLELEGSADWIDLTASLLGFRETEYILASYAQLHMNWRRLWGVPPGDMVFEKPDAETRRRGGESL